MTTTQKITKTATAADLTPVRENQELVLRNAAGDAVASATIADGRFYGGYTIDRLGHVVSHSTVRDFLAGIAA